MKSMTHLRSVVAAAVALLFLTPAAAAEDIVKVASAQRGAWEAAAPELGQRAGIFKKHGIVLELVSTHDSGETEARVAAGSVDVGLGVGAMAALRAYSRGAPVRIIGANLTGGTNYWYVPANSPIKSIKDIVGKTIAYASSGSSSHYDMLDLIRQFKVKARPVLTGGAAATLNRLMLSRVDVGWATPPFGIAEIEEGKIRVVARATDVPRLRTKTTSVILANAGVLAERADVVARFISAYRETIEWMYANSAALEHYAEIAGVSESLARRQRDEFFPKAMLSPDQIVGLRAIMRDAVAADYIQVRLSRRQVAELIRIPPPVRDGLAGCKNVRAGCSTVGPAP
jgi:NitT/TauT family transport system substrate-binding protein